MRIALIVSLACVLGTIRAEESAAASPGAGDAIESAKRDFDAVKAQRDRALQSKGELRITTPELQLEGLEPRLLDQPTKKKKLLEKELADRKAKAAHWLVDAMQKEKNLDSQEQSGLSRNEREKTEMVREQDRTLELLRGESADDPLALGASRDTDRKSAKEQRPAVPVINPLTRYMGDWMTSQDFALLRSNLGDGAAKDAITPGGALSGAGPAAAADLGSSGGIEASIGAIGTSRGSSLPSAPRENPFLSGLASVGAPPPSYKPPPALVLSPPPASASVFVNPPRAPGPARSNVPDFAKPSVDDKYFKPLKRF